MRVSFRHTFIGGLHASPSCFATGLELELVHGGAGSSSNPASPAFGLTLKPRPLGQEHSQKGDCGMNTPGATDNRARSINTRTGGESHTVTDLSFPGACGQLGLMRSYSSLATDLYTTTLGYGWAHSLDTRLIFPDQPGGVSGQVLLKFQTANQYIFFDNGDGTYTPYPGVLGALTATTAPAGFQVTLPNQTVYLFDSTGRLLALRDAQNHSRTYTYTNGLLTRVEDDSSVPSEGQRYLTLQYDGQGHIQAVGDPLGRTVQYGYDANGDLTTVVDARGKTWTYHYDGAHRLTEYRNPLNETVMRLEYDAQGRAVREFDGLGQKTIELEYHTTDGMDGTRVITDAVGNVNVATYDWRGTLTNLSDDAGQTQKSYAANFRPARVSDPNGRATQLTWSSDGRNLTRLVDARGMTTTLTYDALNNLTQTLDALGRASAFDYDGTLLRRSTDALGNTTLYTYTVEGFLQAVTDARGSATTYTYNPFGQRTSTTDALEQTTTLTPTIAPTVSLNRIWITDPNDVDKTVFQVGDPIRYYVEIDNTTGSAQPITMRWQADGPCGTLSDNSIDQTQPPEILYHALDRILTSNCPGEYTYTFTLTWNGAAASRSMPFTVNPAPPTNTPTPTVTPNGSPTATPSPTPTDPLLRLIHRTNEYRQQYSCPLLTPSPALMTAAQSHSDDMALNDFFGHTGSDGSSPLERILAAGYSNTYLSENLAAGVSSPEDVVDRWMNETPPNDGHKQNIINCNFTDIGVGYAWAASSGYVHFWTQDLGKPGQATLTPSATRTATSTRTPTPEFTPTATWTPSITPTPTQTPVNLAPLVIEYQYDPLYRLTGTNYTGAYTSTFTYAYDSVGNRLTQTIDGITTNYAYDNANRLTSVAPNGGAGVSYSWDNNGNLLSDGVNTYAYNQANRLIGVNGQTTNATFAYNGVGDRLQQTIDGVTTNYALDLNAGLTQVLADGTNNYLYGVGRIAQYDNAMQYFGADGLGSVRQIYNAAGVVRRNTLYDPFGNVLTTNGIVASVYGFTGEQADAAGLVYLRARYYAPTQGRFVTRDVWEGDYQRPLSLNRWNYVEGNPINLTDPSGNVSESERLYLRMLYDRYIKDAANRLNVPSLTSLSKNGFAAMVGGKILMEDSTIYADDLKRGVESELSTYPLLFLGRPLRDLFEQNIPQFEKQISWGPGNIPLGQHKKNLMWWEEMCGSYGLSLNDLHTNYYAERKYKLRDPDLTIIWELFSSEGAVEAISLSILQSAWRAHQYWIRQGEPSHPVTAYDIALGQIAFPDPDEEIYPIEKWTGRGSHYTWVIAMKDAAEIFGIPLSVPADYVPWTDEEKQKLDELK